MLKIVFPLLLASASAFAETAAAIYGAANCRIGTLLPEPVDQQVTWSGACKDGYAEGPGTLGWNDAGDSKRRIEGTLAQGVVSGEAKLTYAPGEDERYWGKERTSYEGTLRNGRPDGQGFFQYANGAMYEGGVAGGAPQGTGIYQDLDRSRYEGQWVDGKRQGHGKATYAAGGSYDGAWKNDRFDGAGTIVYAGPPRTWQGIFVDGRPANVARPDIAEPIRYDVRDDHMRTGSRQRDVTASLSIPPAASWAQLSVAQQNRVKALAWSTLAPGDEPPYPVKGVQPILELVSLIQGQNALHGRVKIFVAVGSDGKAKKASVFGKVSAEIARQLSAAAMAQAYKPAMCEGAPCDMIYPFSVFML